MKFAAFLSLFITLTYSSARGASASHSNAVEKLFVAIQMDKQYEEGMLAGFDAASKIPAEHLATLSGEEQKNIQRKMAVIRKKMVELNGWPKIKPQMVELYARHFSEKEIEAILRLTKDPTYQMLLKKQLILLREAMEIGQKQAQETMPEIMKAVAESEQANAPDKKD